MAAPQPCLPLGATGSEHTPHTDLFLSARHFSAQMQCLKRSDCAAGVGDEQWQEEKRAVSEWRSCRWPDVTEGREAALRARSSFQVSCSQDLHAISWMWFAPRAISTAVKFQQMNNVVFNTIHQAKERILTRSCWPTFGLRALLDPTPFMSWVFPVGAPGTPEVHWEVFPIRRGFSQPCPWVLGGAGPGLNLPVPLEPTLVKEGTKRGCPQLLVGRGEVAERQFSKSPRGNCILGVPFPLYSHIQKWGLCSWSHVLIQAEG